MVTGPAAGWAAREARGARTGSLEGGKGGEGGEEGYALLLALFVLFILAFALALLGESLAWRMRLVRQEAQTVALVALADAALAETLSNLAAAPAFPGVPEHPFGGGTVASSVQPLGPRRYRVVATATYATRKRAVEALVTRDASGTQVTAWRRLGV
jgi:hypothetical protein